MAELCHRPRGEGGKPRRAAFCRVEQAEGGSGGADGGDVGRSVEEVLLSFEGN